MYRVTVNGITIECETAEQALELARQATGDALPDKSTRNNGTTTTGTRWTDRRMRDLLKALSPGQLKLLDAMLGAPDGITDKALRSQLGLTNNSALGGVFTGLIRNVKKVSGDPNDLYVTEKVNIGGETMNEFKLSPSFRPVMERVVGE